MATPYCRHCGHPAHRADCGCDDCGCVRYEPRDRTRSHRTWLVDAQFLTRNGWTPSAQQRVAAAGHGGALMKGVRAAKIAVLRPRQRVEQVRVTLTPVPGGRSRSVRE